MHACIHAYPVSIHVHTDIDICLHTDLHQRVVVSDM